MNDLEALIARIRFVAFDFDGVFTDNTVYVSQDGTEMVRCWRGDGIGLRKLDRLGIATAIISTETNPVVSMRANKLKIRCVQGVEDKRAALDQMVQELGITLVETAFVGNDVNDLPCLRVVGLPVVVQDAHPDIPIHAHYITRLPGGRGAVREPCDLFEHIHAR